MTEETVKPKTSSADAVVTIAFWLIGGILFLVLAAAILLPSFIMTAEQARVVSCANNLAQLWKAQGIYKSMYASKEKMMPLQTGSAFWLQLKRTPKPIIDPSNEDIYLCPVLGVGTIGKDIHYYGPGAPVNQLRAEDPVGSDDMVGNLNGEGIPNHGADGGNLFWKSGDVREISEAQWKDLTGVSGKGSAFTKPIP